MKLIRHLITFSSAFIAAHFATDNTAAFSVLLVVVLIGVIVWSATHKGILNANAQQFFSTLGGAFLTNGLTMLASIVGVSGGANATPEAIAIGLASYLLSRIKLPDAPAAAASGGNGVASKLPLLFALLLPCSLITSCALTPAQRQAMAVAVLDQTAVTALSDLVTHKDTAGILTDAASTVLSSITTQAQQQGAGTGAAFVLITAEGQTILRDLIAKQSTKQTLTDAELIALKALVTPTAS